VITRRTKVQLVIFVVLTLVGVAYVGARYAQLDRLFVSRTYEVTGHFANSGGVFAGALVSYRGEKVGLVDRLELTDTGVDVVMEIENTNDAIPADLEAVVGNRSAVGEQYVDLRPRTDTRPFLRAGSEIAEEDTALPIQTDKLLTDITTTVSSVDRDALRTTVDELGAAFDGTGDDLQRIFDTSSSFIRLANENFDTTTALIRDGNTVLTTQVDSESALRTFARDLSLFSTSLADADPDLRKVIDNTSPAVNQLKALLDASGVELGELLNNLVTTGQIVVQRLNGIETLLSIYPYVVEGGFTVVSKTPSTGLYDAHFGLVLSTTTPCHQGYQGTDTRPPSNGDNRAMNTDARCTEPITQANPRGAQNLPPRAPADYDAPVAAFDPATGELTWGAEQAQALEDQATAGTVAPRTLGEESWKWLFLQPLTSRRE
jgi:phospholipid/cholesterol/gamma-HCH transport system substrate-binding protein